MVEANIDFLVARGRRADGLYIHRFDPDGGVFDDRADLYDQAFMLLALAYAAQALGRLELFAVAEALDDALDAQWRLPHGGYHEGDIAACPPYRQNPHMHLLESFIALYTLSGNPRWRRDAEHIARLCARSFLHRETGALIEVFRRRSQSDRWRGGPCHRARPLLRVGMAVRKAGSVGLSGGDPHFRRARSLRPSTRPRRRAGRRGQ